MANIDKESKDDIAKLLLEQFELCPICMESFGEKIFQCSNAHLHCEDCWSKLEKLESGESRCSSCRRPVNGRCRQGEEIRAKFTVKCENKGCDQSFKLGEAKNHDCIYAPFECREKAPGANLRLFECCTERVSPSMLEFHLMSEHGAVRHLSTKPGTWLFDYKSDKLAQGESEVLTLLERDKTEADLFLWIRLDATSHYGYPSLSVIPCSRWRDDKRRVRVLLHIVEREFELVHTMRVRPWDERWTGLYLAPSVVANWAFNNRRWTVKFVVCVDPHLDEEFPVLNPMLKEAKENPRKRKRTEYGLEKSTDEFHPSLVQVNDEIDACDRKGKWYAAVVKRKVGTRALVHFHAWSADFDEWVECDEEHVAELGAKTQEGSVAAITPPGTPER